jgi:hypothetical protein
LLEAAPRRLNTHTELRDALDERMHRVADLGEQIGIAIEIVVAGRVRPVVAGVPIDASDRAGRLQRDRDQPVVQIAPQRLGAVGIAMNDDRERATSSAPAASSARRSSTRSTPASGSTWSTPSTAWPRTSPSSSAT